MRWYVKGRRFNRRPFTSEMVADMYGRRDLTGRHELRDGRRGPWRSFERQVEFELHLGQGRIGFGHSLPESPAYATASLTALTCAMIGVIVASSATIEGLPLTGVACCVALVVAGAMAGWKGYVPRSVERKAMGLNTFKGNVGLCMANALACSVCLVGIGIGIIAIVEGAAPEGGSSLPQARYVEDCVQVSSLGCNGQRFVLTGNVGSSSFGVDACTSAIPAVRAGRASSVSRHSDHHGLTCLDVHPTYSVDADDLRPLRDRRGGRGHPG